MTAAVSVTAVGSLVFASMCVIEVLVITRFGKIVLIAADGSFSTMSVAMFAIAMISSLKISVMTMLIVLTTPMTLALFSVSMTRSRYVGHHMLS
jgi:hypothetical protein